MFDLLDPQARACPHLYNQWLQSDLGRRVYKAPFENSFYVVHRYEDVKFVLTNHKLFSSAILPTRQSPFLALMDGEDHLRQRAIVTEIFQIEAPTFPLKNIQKFIQQTTLACVQKKRADVLDQWATVIPLASLSMVFGLTADRTALEKLHDYAMIINRALFVLGGTGPRRQPTPTLREKLAISYSLLKNISKLRRLKKSVGSEGWATLKRMFLPVKTQYENPRPDFSYMPDALHALLELMIMFEEALVDEGNQSHGVKILRQSIHENKISKLEAILLCTFILFAGYETSVSLISNGVAHLAKDKALLKQLKQNPGRLDSFIEECLRFYTPVGRFLRRTNEEVRIGEYIIPKGAMVIAMLTATNTDPDRFSDSYSFLSEREKNAHISFGKGIHFCVGAPLARFQAKVSFQELLAIVNTITIDPEKKLEWVTDRDNGILRYEELWINFD